ncbi:acetamidase/formamidase family protein [Mesorhizobium sp. DCY119]|uniref:acetamidase/formamidase family protein n=1 Tax=Mesorhizobium sp. DCY119 TaxID=2108445 RepID=UPI000E762379|nr:acetamidase/formamidase family protein [Mesorhizobium sp. DCY119]RJG40472.1 hypothetical protein D3Y55_24555 [Mesorhizobium sp. DCY119]
MIAPVARFTERKAQMRIDAHDPVERFYIVGPHVECVAQVAQGEKFTLRTLDASGNQFRADSSYDQIDRSRIFPVTGPVSIADAEVGDGIGIGISSIQMDPIGHCWTRPGLGLANPGWFAVKALRTDGETISIADDDVHPVQLTPHVGSLGVLPTGSVRGADLGSHGGNLDVPFLSVGSMIWLPVRVPGAGVFAGDVHAAMGDGEISGTGIEVGAEITLAATSLTDWEIAHPIVMHDDCAWVIGIGGSVEGALAKVLPTLIMAVKGKTGETDEQAYLLVSLLLKLKICQVVNSQVSIAVTLGAGFDRQLAPSGAWNVFNDFRANLSRD